MRNYLGNTELHSASYLGKVDVVKKLIGANADLEVKNGRGETALMLAGDDDRDGFEFGMWHEDLKTKGDKAEEVMEILKDAGADLEAKDMYERTAAFRHSEEISKLLQKTNSYLEFAKGSIDRGLICWDSFTKARDLNLGEIRGLIRKMEYHARMVLKLQKLGANMDVKDDHGRPKMKKLLLEVRRMHKLRNTTIKKIGYGLDKVVIERDGDASVVKNWREFVASMAVNDKYENELMMVIYDVFGMRDKNEKLRNLIGKKMKYREEHNKLGEMRLKLASMFGVEKVKLPEPLKKIEKKINDVFFNKKER